MNFEEKFSRFSKRVPKYVLGATLAGAALFGPKNIEAANNQDNVATVDFGKEKTKETPIERNRKFLIEEENVVPDVIMENYAQVVDKRNILIPAGGYFEKDCINTSEEEKEFAERMKQLGYDEDGIEKLREIFSGHQIVFKEAALREKDFLEILKHERLHKEISLLPREQKKTLNEAVIHIFDDYQKKERILSQKTDQPEFVDLLRNNSEIYTAKRNEIISSLDLEPILLDVDGNFDKGIAVSLIGRPQEFYPYLMMGKLSFKTEQFVREHFPASYKIYQELKDKIEKQISERLK
jgi:hypothetical protein